MRGALSPFIPAKAGTQSHNETPRLSFRGARETREPGIQSDTPELKMDSGFAGRCPRPGMTTTQKHDRRGDERELLCVRSTP